MRTNQQFHKQAACFTKMFDQRNALELTRLMAENALMRMHIRLHEERNRPENAVPTATEAIRQVIKNEMNGVPVSRHFMREQGKILFAGDDKNMDGGIGECAREGLIEQAGRGMWLKVKKPEREPLNAPDDLPPLPR